MFRVTAEKFAFRRVGSEFGISAANLQRAHGGCLGVKSEKGVEVCEKLGGVDKRALIPRFLNCSYAEYHRRVEANLVN